MASNLIKGTVELADGTVLPFVAGARERIFAERHFKKNIKALQEKDFGEEYVVYQAFLALQRTGDLPKNQSFEAFLDENFGGYEVAEVPESPAQPDA